MEEKTTNREMKSKVEQLEREIVEHVRKEKEQKLQQELVESGNTRRTLSLMKIIDELHGEIKALRRADQDQLNSISHHLGERVKELNTLYDISRLRSGTNFSLDQILQAVVDFVPSAIPYPENTCARILFDQYAFATRNFKNTKWKLSQDIKINNVSIGVLEICYLEKMPKLVGDPFFLETEKLVAAIAESIAQIVEREWAEIEIRDGRSKIDALIKTKSG